MYLSDEADALISCGGGELMCEILDDVDFDAIKAAKPKWYMGYSDNTNFTFFIDYNLRCGIHLWTMCRNIWYGTVG